MRFRKLRIAWSVFWGVACVLLVVLWVRSYLVGDLITLSGKGVFSANGVLEFSWFKPLPPPWPSWEAGSFSARNAPKPIGSFSFNPFANGFSIDLPDWFVAIMFGAIGSISWLHRAQWRFRLRTLLIATTLIALLLGAAVYATR
jgi:hypothetical protein